MAITLAKPITGAPYMAGDLVQVEVFGKWAEAVVDGIVRDHSGKFGLRWTMHVMVLDTQDFLYVRCDDNGRNHTYRQQVCPSSRIQEA